MGKLTELQRWLALISVQRSVLPKIIKETNEIEGAAVNGWWIARQFFVVTQSE